MKCKKNLLTMRKKVDSSRNVAEEELEEFEEFIDYDTVDDNPFEKLRQQNIKRNKQIFQELDIAVAKALVSESTRKKKKNLTGKREVKKVLPLKEKSTRIKNLPQRYTSEIGSSISSSREIVECAECGDMTQLSSLGGKMKHGMCSKCWDSKSCTICMRPSTAIPQVLMCVKCGEIQHRVCGKISKVKYKKLRLRKFVCKSCCGGKGPAYYGKVPSDILRRAKSIRTKKLPQRYTSSISSSLTSKAREIVECTECGDMTQPSSLGKNKYEVCAKCWDLM